MSYQHALQHHVLRCLDQDLELAQGSVTVDGSALSFDFLGQPCRVETSDEHARIRAVAAVGVRPTVRALREVNAWNGRLTGARAHLDEQRRVVVTAEVRAESLEPGELGALLSAVTDCARHLGPLVGLVHGTPPAASRNEEVDR